MVKHKIFISFYNNDEDYKIYLSDVLKDDYINMSVDDGDYDPLNSDEYIKRLIREERVSNSSVIIVLIGENTRYRKHVDWEIYAGLARSINGASGLIGILLPTVLRNGYFYDPLCIPERLQDNINSGYASLCTWNEFIRNYKYIIEQAFVDRVNKTHLIDNSRLQMKENEIAWQFLR